MGKFLLYESATEELCKYLERDDFRVMWNSDLGKYEIQQYISEGWDDIKLIMDGKLTYLFYPCYFWATVLMTKEWNHDIMKDIKLSLIKTGKEIITQIEKSENKTKADNDKYIEEGCYEMAKDMVQATEHKKIYSTLG